MYNLLKRYQTTGKYEALLQNAGVKSHLRSEFEPSSANHLQAFRRYIKGVDRFYR
jgi:hypothetical protein